MIDLVQGNTAADVRAWLGAQPPEWLAGITTVATDLHEGFRAGLSPDLDHAVKVADAFHVVQVANRCLDQTRRRVQNETLGHRGRKDDPLYRIRRIMLTGAERLDEHGTSRFLLGMRAGDPHDEVLGAWLAKESVRDVYLANSRADAEALLDKDHHRRHGRRCRRDPCSGRHPEALETRDPRPPSTPERPTGQPKASTSW